MCISMSSLEAQGRYLCIRFRVQTVIMSIRRVGFRLSLGWVQDNLWRLGFWAHIQHYPGFWLVNSPHSRFIIGDLSTLRDSDWLMEALNKISFHGSDTFGTQTGLWFWFCTFFVRIWGLTIWHLNCNQEKMAQNLLNFQLLVDALLFFLLPNYLKVNLNFGETYFIVSFEIGAFEWIVMRGGGG